MEIEYILIFFFLGCAVYSLNLSLRLLFQKGYVEKKRAGIWKIKAPWFHSKSSYNYDKYARAIEALFIGIVCLIMAVAIFFGPNI